MSRAMETEMLLRWTERELVENNFNDRIMNFIRHVIADCKYAPNQYIERVRELGGARAAKQLLSEPPSDDSVDICARGRPDLTIEAIVLNEEWKTLFSEELRAEAARRLSDMPYSDTAVPLAMQTPDELPDFDLDFVGTWGTILFPDDDIAWGEELIEGTDVCEKLGQQETLLTRGCLDNFDGWPLGYYRQHLADCAHCDTERLALKQALDKFDHTNLKTISELLARCVSCMNCDQDRATE